MIAAVLCVAGCGGGSKHGSLGTPLSYFPKDAGLVTVVSTDLDSSRYSELNGLFGRRIFDGKALEDLIAEGVDEVPGITYKDVKPVLGNDLVLGSTSHQALLPNGARDFIAALEVRDKSRLRKLLGKIGGVHRKGKLHGADAWSLGGGERLVLNGDVLVYGSSPAAVTAAIERSRHADHLTEKELDAAGEGLPRKDAVIRFYGDLRGVFEYPLLARFKSVRWVGALRAGAASASIEDDRLVLDGVANTSSVGLTEADLPLVAGDAPPPLPSVPRRITSASANQSQTTVFLLRAFRAAYPQSHFVRDVAQLERDLHIDFEREVLRQFNGRSASEIDGSGGFAARSAVRDPERMRKLLPLLAPRLPQLVQDLDGLRGTGRALLLMFAPDAPVSTAAAAGGVRVAPAGGSGSDLYRVSGLKGEGPHEIFLGLVGDVFVVASDEQRARAIATAPEVPAPDGSHGAAVTAVDFSQVPEGSLLSRVGFNTQVLGPASGWLQASTARLRAHAEFEWRP